MIRRLSFSASLFVLLASFAAAVCSAQSRAFDCKKGSEITASDAGGILDRVQKAYGGISDLHGDFEQESYLAALDTGESSSGEMWFSKPGKMRWEYTAPRKQSVVIRDGTLWLYQVDKHQLMIDDIGQVLLSDLPVSFMMGLGSLSRDFTLKAACRSPEGVVLSLVPKPAPGGEDRGRSELEGFELLVDEGQSLPKGAKVVSVGGNTTAILFKGLTGKGIAADPARFVLTAPKGVDVMDRRGSAQER